MTADLSLAEFPGRKFQGKLVRTADAINMTTRTLLIEIDVDNPTGTLLTGSYAEVHLSVPTQASTLLASGQYSAYSAPKVYMSAL